MYADFRFPAAIGCLHHSRWNWNQFLVLFKSEHWATSRFVFDEWRSLRMIQGTTLYHPQRPSQTLYVWNPWFGVSGSQNDLKSLQTLRICAVHRIDCDLHEYLGMSFYAVVGWSIYTTSLMWYNHIGEDLFVLSLTCERWNRKFSAASRKRVKRCLAPLESSLEKFQEFVSHMLPFT